MGTAREVASKYPSPILNFAYRRRQLEFRRKQISQWLENETEMLKFEIESRQGEELPADYVSERFATIEREAKRQESEALSVYGMLAGSDPSIAPLRRALAVWGLTIDDVGVASVRSLLFFSASLQYQLTWFPPFSSTVPRPSPTTRTSRELTTSSSATSVAPRVTLARSSLRSGSPCVLSPLGHSPRPY